MPPSAWRRVARGGSGATPRHNNSMPKRAGSPNASRPHSGVREIETYALALDGAKKPCRVRTSNAGQVLFTGIAAADRAARVAKELLQPSFFLRLGHSHGGQRRGAL